MPNSHRRRTNVRLTSQDIASYCQVSKSTVLSWIKNGKLKAFSLPSGHFRIDKKDFVDFLNEWQMPVQDWLQEDRANNKNSKIRF